MKSHNSSVFDNGTAAAISDVPDENILILIDTTLFVLVFFLNGFVLMIFATHRMLWTSFSVYVISLLTCNIISNCITLDSISINRYPVFRTLGPAFCSFYEYGNWVVSGAASAWHGLIALNRAWGILYPVSYYRHHTSKFALILCGAVWVFIHVICLPGLILDALYYRQPIEKFGCGVDIEVQKTWSLLVEGTVYAFPLVLVIGSYFVVTVATVKRKRMLRLMRPATLKSVHSYSSTGKAQLRDESHAFFVLTMMTLGVLICWVPNDIGVFVSAFSDDFRSRWSYGSIGFYADCLYEVQAVFDPLVFTFCMADLRAIVMGYLLVVRKCMIICFRPFSRSSEVVSSFARFSAQNSPGYGVDLAVECDRNTEFHMQVDDAR